MASGGQRLNPACAIVWSGVIAREATLQARNSNPENPEPLNLQTVIFQLTGPADFVNLAGLQG